MVKEEKQSHPVKLSSIRAWFDFKRKYINNWLFMLHRFTGVALTIYLILHVKTVSLLTEGKEIYNTSIKEFETFGWLIVLFLIIIIGIFHGLNGIRLFLYQFSFGVKHQRTLSITVITLTAIATVLVAYILFI
ncbi:MAG: succinate dehydrogenase, cytochrome b556 subunit [Nitrososphaerales archaeon]